jgi:MFS family permease
MYEGDWVSRLAPLVRQAKAHSQFDVPPNVWGLGVTSLLTDVSSEMLISVLPAYLVLTGGLAPLALGVTTGLHESGPLLVTWVGGWIADRSGKRKLTATAGYALSAVCRLGWLLISGRTVAALAALVVGDRAGKAIRTAPRDAIISFSASPNRLATAFGVHRALDAAGAAMGPILAWLLLWHLPRRYDVIFFTSFVVALLGVAAITLLVDESPGWRSPLGYASTSQAGDQPRIFTDRAFRRILILAIGFGSVTIGDAFLYLLVVQRSHASAEWIPLLYSGTAISFLTLAAPFGYIADLIGRRRTFILGHGPLLLAYVTVLSGGTAWPWNGIMSVLLLGAYYASSDGVLASLAGGLLQVDIRSRGLAWVATAASVGRLCSSIVFGWLWTRWGDVTAVTSFASALVAVVAFFGWSKREAGLLRSHRT